MCHFPAAFPNLSPAAVVGTPLFLCIPLATRRPWVDVTAVDVLRARRAAFVGRRIPDP